MAPEEERAPPSGPALGGVPGVPAGLYHERQRLELCALHALNNLLQQPWLSKAAADGICQRLAPRAWPNPHRSPLGTGNYDINLVMAALGTRGLAAVWWDKRRPLERLALPHILGFLLNVRSRLRLGALPLPLARPHWLGLRRLGGAFYNLDCKLPAPAAIGTEGQLREFLREALAKGPSELFLVVTQEVEEAGTWLSPE